MQQIPVSLLTLVAGIVVTIFSIWVGQNHHLLPIQASQQAPLVDGFFNVMVSIATALFLVVEGTIVIFLVKYRRRQGDNTDGVDVEGNFPLEIFWTAIPAVIVLCLGIYSVDVFQQMGGFEPGSHPHLPQSHSKAHVAHIPGSAIAATLSDGAADESQEAIPEIGIGANPKQQGKKADLVVNVTGMQFAWLFNYPDSGVSTGELHVPVGADVQLNLSATDVIHSFWVPQFRLKQDAIPGIPTELRFVATKPGTYPVVCTELCGGYHGSMRSQVVVHTPEEFESWLQENSVANKQQLNQAVAINPAKLSNSEFLAPYTHELGITSETLKKLGTGN
ncbi:cytochrome c oxidase subunit II [Aetokthonos hydrillicola Thurmond2011]|jgi:cytochrome c oxidase subunit 2|uniref:Cytochrome c oxidase subunit 2 n=3 Tax=Aetokthonos TaxID=1550243 RepID=A0AAP5I6I0_9CYAN|nr:cytochrome c oxidase subunit II [Aetokthonos hydrillicola]MBW4586746.1 cytochrome c oxidase subunit II [Aetokthonos hydrillicola CCALA 1050]MDR9895897.1 cytochrome c oxidase subunit II [Aetokthonos hydrillicola Thurmond2011]